MVVQCQRQRRYNLAGLECRNVKKVLSLEKILAGYWHQGYVSYNSLTDDEEDEAVGSIHSLLVGGWLMVGGGVFPRKAESMKRRLVCRWSIGERKVSCRPLNLQDVNLL